MSFIILILVIVANACMPRVDTSKCGFQDLGQGQAQVQAPIKGEIQIQDQAKASEKQVPDPIPLKENTISATAQLTDLPSAPITGLASVNPLPQTDPVDEKSSTAMLKELKADMDGFYKQEYPNMKEMSDPSVKLPLTQFLGEYRRVRDELSVLQKNPGITPQISIQELNDMGANLRYLQRSYRSLANVELVSPTEKPLSKVGVKEGFSTSGYSEDEKPITLTQLKLLQTAIGAEIIRLQASGTTDPVIKARIAVFTKINTTVSDLITKIGNGSMKEADIPIKVKDYKNFLPALGSSSAGIGGILSSYGFGSLSNLFNSYDIGDVSGSQLAATLFERYAKDMLSGLSYNLSVSYTSDNDVRKQRALASYARAYANSKLHPGTEGARGEFDETIRKLDTVSGFENGTSDSVRPPSVLSGNPGSFDWKARAEAITENIKRAGMNPSDYGCLEKGETVSSGYSWRGHARMICSRLATNADPATPEQMGCPPVSWKGWRS
jgi:hypothetical protein